MKKNKKTSVRNKRRPEVAGGNMLPCSLVPPSQRTILRMFSHRLSSRTAQSPSSSFSFRRHIVFLPDLELGTVRRAGDVFTSLSARAQVIRGRGQVRHFDRWQGSASASRFPDLQDLPQMLQHHRLMRNVDKTHHGIPSWQKSSQGCDTR